VDRLPTAVRSSSRTAPLTGQMDRFSQGKPLERPQGIRVFLTESRCRRGQSFGAQESSSTATTARFWFVVNGQQVANGDPETSHKIRHSHGQSSRRESPRARSKHHTPSRPRGIVAKLVVKTAEGSRHRRDRRLVALDPTTGG